MVGVGRVELPTPAMSTQCSTTELYARTIIRPRIGVCRGAGSGALAKLRAVCKRFAYATIKNPVYRLASLKSSKTRSTSITRSRKWKGFDNTFA